jgi:hypothetical protein
MPVRNPQKIVPEHLPRRKSWQLLGLARQLFTAVTGGALLMGLITGYAFWRSGPRYLEGLKLMLAPPPPEEQVDVRTIVVQQVREASELSTAVFTMEAVVPAESDRTLAGYVIGKTNLLYIAYGEVRAGLDLSALQPADVQVLPTAAPTLQITLPPPQILDSKIDVNRSSVYDYNRGFLSLGPDRAPQLQVMAQQVALDKIEQAACEQGILQTANDRARLVVSQLLNHAGYSQVVVKTQMPEQCRPPQPTPLPADAPNDLSQDLPDP